MNIINSNRKQKIVSIYNGNIIIDLVHHAKTSCEKYVFLNIKTEHDKHYVRCSIKLIVYCKYYLSAIKSNIINNKAV